MERLFSVAGILATCEGCCISHKLLEELISIKYNQFILKIKTNTFTMNYTLPTYDQINNNKHIFIYKFLFLECITHIFLKKHVHTYIQYNHPLTHTNTHTYTHHTYCTVSLFYSLCWSLTCFVARVYRVAPPTHYCSLHLVAPPSSLLVPPLCW